MFDNYAARTVHMGAMDDHLEEVYEDMNGDPFGFVENSDDEFDPDPEDYNEEVNEDCYGHEVSAEFLSGVSTVVAYCLSNEDCPGTGDIEDGEQLFT